MWRNWKTTLAGAALAAWHVVQNGVNWRSLLTAALTAAVGALAADHDNAPKWIR